MKYNLLLETSQKTHLLSEEAIIYKYVFSNLDIIPGSVKIKVLKDYYPGKARLVTALQTNGNMVGILLEENEHGINHIKDVFFTTELGFYAARSKEISNKEIIYTDEKQFYCWYYDQIAYKTIKKYINKKCLFTRPVLPDDFKKLGIVSDEYKTVTIKEIREKEGLENVFDENYDFDKKVKEITNKIIS